MADSHLQKKYKYYANHLVSTQLPQLHTYNSAACYIFSMSSLLKALDASPAPFLFHSKHLSLKKRDKWGGGLILTQQGTRIGPGWRNLYSNWAKIILSTLLWYLALDQGA